MTRKTVFELLSSPIATLLLFALLGLIRLLKGHGSSSIYMASLILLFVMAVVSLVAVVVRIRSSS
jgi:hypothetical protein